MDPVIHLSEGHRSNMLLDLSVLTREKRIVQASISNARDFHRVAEAHPTSTYPLVTESKTNEGQRRIQTCRLSEHSLVPRIKSRQAHWQRKIRNECSSRETHLRCCNNDCDEDLDESANAYQAHNDPVDLGSDDGDEALDHDDDEENDTLSSYIAVDDVAIHEW